MASNLTPSKRPSDENPLESEVPSKSQKTGPASVVRQRPVTYKVLCPVSQSGSVIGKGGSIVSRIRQETSAKIKLEDAVPGCNERIVIITSFYKEKEVQKVSEESERDETAEKEEEAEEQSEAVLEEKVMPAAFDALMRVFERVMLEESDLEEEEGDEGKRESVKEKETERASLFVTFKMLVLSGQVGSLLGKGGIIIKKIMADSGAQVRVLSRDLLPLCAKPQEDVVQVLFSFLQAGILTIFQLKLLLFPGGSSSYLMSQKY
jgi:poly(rC)-binding protein 3/4